MVALDDGVLKIYEVENGTSNGTMPTKVLKFKLAVKYELSTLGITRYYTAMTAGHQLEAVVIVYPDPKIRVGDIVIDEFGNQTKIHMIQPYKEDGLKMWKLTLERTDLCYEIQDTC